MSTKYERNQRTKAQAMVNRVVECVHMVVGDTTIEAGTEGTSRPRFKMLLYSGGPIRPSGWNSDHPLVLDLAGMSVARSGPIPFNRGHAGDTMLVGHGTPHIMADRVVIEDGVFSFDNQATREIVDSSQSGFVWASSMEATLLTAPIFIPSGKSVSVNRRTISGPVYLAKQTQLFAGAFIGSNPADRSTTVSIAAETRENDEQDTENVAIKVQSFATAIVDTVADIRARSAAEVTRIGMIGKHCGDEYPEIRAQAISEGWDEHRVELAVVKAKYAALEADRASRSSGPAVHSRSGAELMNADVFAAAMHQNMLPNTRGSQVIADCYGAPAAEASARLPKQAGLQYLLVSTIRAAGGHVEPGVGMSAELWQRAIRANAILSGNADINATSAFSTFSLSTTMSNLANKRLLQIYREFPSLIGRLTTPAVHTDFKAWTKVRIDDDLNLLPLAPTGEIQHGTISETSYENKLATYARMLAVTREDFFNDDLGAFNRLGTQFGMAALRTRERAFWTVVASPSSTFFSVGNKNLVTGQATFSAAAVRAAEELMLNQVSPEGNPIMVMPDLILVSILYKKDAENLLQKRTVHVTGDPGATTQLRIEDQYQGEYAFQASPWLNTGMIAGAVNTTWYLFGSSVAGVSAFEYATLSGEGGPQMDSADTDFNTLGWQQRCYWDWGFARQDPRAAVKVTA